MERPRHHIRKLNVIFAIIFLSFIIGACSHVCKTMPSEPKRLKYVFYFIGDGMAGVQVHATEAYRAAIREDDTVAGGVKTVPLEMSRFPVIGLQTSFANNRLITGSAAAGTALACGMKTNIDVIAKSPDLALPYISIAQVAKNMGMKVGILSSVPINHATPAAFYAHVDHRKKFHDIALQLARSDFDFFGGGYWQSTNASESGNATEIASTNGFTITHTMKALMAQSPGSRVIAFDRTQVNGGTPGAFKYALDCQTENISLSQLTEQAIRLLVNPNGFFMMVEGGKIDWACHANDARTAFDEVIAFDDAINVAIDFARQHPGETLIVVTGDHECGGLSLGYDSTGYDSYLEVLEKQIMSHEQFEHSVIPGYRTAHSPLPEDIDADMWQIVLATFGMDGAGITTDTGDDLTSTEKSQLEAAFDETATLYKKPANTSKRKYYEDTPLTTALIRILNHRAGLSWASGVHTAAPVPVYAMGANAELFGGYYDNTDVPRKIAEALGTKLQN